MVILESCFLHCIALSLTCISFTTVGCLGWGYMVSMATTYTYKALNHIFFCITVKSGDNRVAFLALHRIVTYLYIPHHKKLSAGGYLVSMATACAYKVLITYSSV